MSYSEFQALSACEAQQVHRAVGNKILQAYAAGLNVVLSNYETPIEDLLESHRAALVELGFEDNAELPKILIKVLADAVRTEGTI